MNSRLRAVGEQLNLARVAVAALIAAVAFGVLTAQKSAKIESAVQHPEFYDTAKAIRRDLTAALKEAAAASEGSRAVSCYLAKYPPGLCGGVPRAGDIDAAPSGRTP